MSWLISGRHVKKQSPPCHLGILSFETAKAMSRLVSVYHSLSDTETHRLQSDLSSSTALSRLTSPDQNHLLSLAAAERLSDLNSIAAAASRLSLRCSDPGLVRFDLVYADLKMGLIDPTRKKLEYGTKTVVRIVDKMARLAGATARLYSSMESLARLEISERKMDTWRRNSPDPKRFEKTTELGLFNDKIDFVKKEVDRLREISLWKTTYDKSVGLLARIVCVVYVRIFVVFGPIMAKNYTNNNNSIINISCMRNDINSNNNGKNYSCLLEDRRFHQRNRKWESKSGPLAAAKSNVDSINSAVADMEARI